MYNIDIMADLIYTHADATYLHWSVVLVLVLLLIIYTFGCKLPVDKNESLAIINT